MNNQALQTGTKLRNGQYTIVKVIGQGGFGITYLATSRQMVSGALGKFQVDVNIALKEFYVSDGCQRSTDGVTLEIPSEGAAPKVEQFRHKFIKEARSIAALNHPNIIHVSEVFEENGTVYYAMKYIEGGSLRDLIGQRQQPLDERQALRYVRQIASALDYMHGQRICHLDVKPANIMLDGNDNAILIDFGIAKRYKDDGEESTSTPLGISKGYTPPEQYQDMLHDFSPASDVYSLGATLYYLLTAQTPKESLEILESGIGQKPAHVSQPVWDLLVKAMQPRRRDRYQSMQQFIDDIDAISNTYNEGATNGGDGENGGDVEVVDDPIFKDDGTTRVLPPDNNPENKPNDVATQPYESARPAKHNMLRLLVSCVAGFLLMAGIFAVYQHFFRMKQVENMVIGRGADTMRFTGTLQGGRPQGYGKAIYTDGRIYEGCFNKGLRQDTNAHFTYPSKREFRGTFAADTIQQGRVSSKDNAMYYVGDFNHDAPWNGNWYETATNRRCFEVKQGKTIPL